MTAGQRWVLVAFVASLAIPLVVLTRGSDRPQLTVLFAVPLVAAVIVVPGFFRLVVAGSLIGALAGFLAGGLGSRMAMRAVALMGGDPEVTVFGTFLVMLAFIVEGALMGAVLAGLRLLRPMSARTVGLITGMTGLTALLIDEVARPEMFHMGIPVINFLMFFGVGFAYGILWELAMSRLLGRFPQWRFAAKRNAER